MRFVSIGVIAALALALAGCNQTLTAPRPPSQAEAEKIVAAAEAAWSGGNIDAVMANYGAGAVVFDSGTLAPITDRAKQTQLNAGFMTMKPADFRVDPRHVQVLDADTIVASGVISLTAQIDPARQLIRTRYSQVYQKQADGIWMIVHEHMSAPPAGSPLP